MSIEKGKLIIKMVLQTKRKHYSLVTANVNDNEDDKTSPF